MTSRGDIRVEPGNWEHAIADADGPQLIVAGPGTGKTEFLVERARYLIASGRVTPAEILILTFSRRGADEISNRIAGSGSPVTATFHAFARRLLEAHGPWAGPDIPALLTSPEQVALVSDLLQKEEPESWPLLFRPLLNTGTLAEEVADFLLRCRERLLGAADVEARIPERPQWASLPAFMRRYDLELVARNRIDYATLVSMALDTLSQPSISQTVASQYRYVLVDEYQDTSPAQARLLELLTAINRNITVTGDPYQSIYSFRGADLTNIGSFPDRFRDREGRPARRLVLTTSFRVPAEILSSALAVVSGGDLPGAAGPVRPAPHVGRVEAYVFDQASAEADWIAALVERLHLEENLAYSKMAVLVRSTRHLLPELSRALERRAIPHESPDQRLVDHPAVRLIFDLAALAVAPLDLDRLGGFDSADRAARRLLLGPLLGISLGKERELLRARRRTGRSWPEILGEYQIGSPELVQLISDPSWARELPAIDGFWKAWTGVPELAGIATEEHYAGYRQALTALAQALDRQGQRDRSISLTTYERIAQSDDFEANPLLSLQRRPRGQLTLTTLHQAKGLEFEVVFIADAAEGVFPDLRRSRALLHPEFLTGTVDSQNRMRFRLQEEMRLAYTAMTRARTRVIWTATAAAIDEGERRPSRFLLAASGAPSFDDLGPPARAENIRPVTAAEAQARFRTLLTDPAAPVVDRLAATAVLAHPPLVFWDPTSFAGVAEYGPDRGVLTGDVSLSPTGAQAYATCPRQFVFERHLETVDRFSPYPHFGSLVHLTLELAEKEAIGGGQAHASVPAALQHLESVWESGADFGSPVLNRAWLDRGSELIVKLYGKWPGQEARGVAAEKRLTAEIGGIRWTGRIDRVESHRQGELRIVDYKTGKNQPTLSEAATSLQLGFYLLAAATDPELMALGKPTAASFWYPEATSPVRRFEPANLDSVEAELIRIGHRILSEDWRPTPGKGCKHCGVRLVCPAWPEGREGFRP